MQVIQTKTVSAKVDIVRNILKSAGNKIGVVHFLKRSDGSKRRMSYRLHVRKPSWVKSPKNGGKKRNDEEKGLLTVFDTNCVNYDKKGKMCGRGGYRSVNLEGVVRISVNGEKYRFVMV